MSPPSGCVVPAALGDAELRARRVRVLVQGPALARPDAIACDADRRSSPIATGEWIAPLVQLITPAATRRLPQID